MIDFDPSIIFLITGYIAFLYVAKLKEYKQMLTANILSCWLASIYMVFNGAYTGAAVSGIAGFASIAQILLSSHSIFGTLKVRNTVAIIFAAIAVTILYQKPSDILPCIGFTQYRIFEAQGSTRYIRFAVLIGTIIWAVYAYSQQLYFMAFLELSVSAYAFTCIIKNAPKNKNAKTYQSCANQVPS